jgi:hypothetical protein
MSINTENPKIMLVSLFWSLGWIAIPISVAALITGRDSTEVQLFAVGWFIFCCLAGGTITAWCVKHTPLGRLVQWANKGS